jgi:2-C-methyl-D-erythritol 4-phosphate cytidylyltransferase
MRKSVIIVAGGIGSRMGGEIPKQFILLENKPVLMWTLSVFLQYDANMPLILVLPESQVKTWQELCRKFDYPIRHRIVSGGETRFHSVKNGLEALGETDLVAIHDGVRPLVSLRTIDNCFSQAAVFGAAIPVMPVNETLRKGSSEHSETVDRSQYHTVQTPQVFRYGLLREAYSSEWNPAFTDDASVVENTGFQVVMVPGNPENIKITCPEDLLVAGAFLKTKKDIG